MDNETLEFLADLEREETQPPASNENLVPQGERLCPICSEKMVVEFEYGVHVDVCPSHGVWLDRGELRAMASLIRSGERINRRKAIKDAKRDGKISGTVFGAWSLLFE